MNQIVTQQQDKRTPMSVAQGLKPHFSETLPKHIDPDAFARTIQTALQVQPELLDATPRSLMIACMKAATDGLILDGREAALVVRNVNVGTRDDKKWEKQATYQPMVQGLLKLARNSGQISSISAHIVFEKDNFIYVLGDDERIEHSPPSFGQDRGAPLGGYVIARLTDGTVVREVMDRKQILNISTQGTNGWQYDPEKGKNWQEWWRKTLIRRISKYIPRSSDRVGDAFHRATEVIDDDFDFTEEEQPPAKQAQKAKGAAAAMLKDITPPQQKTQPQPASQPQDEAPQAKTEEGGYDPDTGEVYDGSAVHETQDTDPI